MNENGSGVVIFLLGLYLSVIYEEISDIKEKQEEIIKKLNSLK